MKKALAKELEIWNIPFERQKAISISYKTYKIGEGQLDFLIDKQLVVELKAIDSISAIHTAQVISYLKTANLRLGLLINFNVPILRQGIKRVILG